MISWPESLPQEMVLNSSEGAPSAVATFEPMAGPPLQWVVGDSRSRDISGQVLLETEEELETFLAFYLTDLVNGTRKFLWRRPGVAEVAVFQFKHPDGYNLQNLARGYWLQLSLIYVRRIS